MRPRGRGRPVRTGTVHADDGADAQRLQHLYQDLLVGGVVVGYQEVLTDPSYTGQIVTMTYPLIGNYGINLEDVESRRPWLSGFIVKEACPYPSSWRSRWPALPMSWTAGAWRSRGHRRK